LFFQSFIFEGIIKRMKIPTFIFTVLSVLGNLVVQAQDPLIKADITQGCDSLKVNFSFDTSIGSVVSYKWKFGDGDSSDLYNPLHDYKRPGAYTVTLTLNGTSTSSRIDFIKVGRIPNRDSLNLSISYRDTSIGIPYTYAIGVQYNNRHPLPFTGYQWTINGVTASDNYKFIHTFDSAGVYKVRLVMADAGGCAATFNDSIRVANDLLVPNVFTPNEDGINDNFVITSGSGNLLVLRIYTRSGLLIFKSEGTMISWDGRLPSGDKVLPGIYFYTLNSSGTGTPVKKNGFFYIYQ
jgi:gliding motility-associated-like protein